MNITKENNNKKLTKKYNTRRHQIKNEIRKLKSQNKKTYKLINFCNQDFSQYKKSFNNEILLYEELLEEIMYTKKLLNISIIKNIEKIDNYSRLLLFK